MGTQTFERLSRAVLLALMALAHAAVLLVVVLADDTGFHLPAVAGLLVASSGAALAAWLLIAGPGRWFVRMPLALALLVALLVAAAISGDRLPNLLAVQAATLVVALVLVRVCGIRCDRETNITTARGGQYSVRSLLIFTAAAAVALFVAKTVRAQVDPGATVPTTLAVCSIGLSLGAISVAAMWAALAPAAPWLRLAVLAVLAPICGAAPAYVCGRDDDMRMFAMSAVLHAATVCGGFLVLRMCGYRLARRRRLAPNSSAAPVRRPASQWRTGFSGEVS